MAPTAPWPSSTGDAVDDDACDASCCAAAAAGNAAGSDAAVSCTWCILCAPPCGGKGDGCSCCCCCCSSMRHVSLCCCCWTCNATCSGCALFSTSSRRASLPAELSSSGAACVCAMRPRCAARIGTRLLQLEASVRQGLAGKLLSSTCGRVCRASSEGKALVTQNKIPLNVPAVCTPVSSSG